MMSPQPDNHQAVRRIKLPSGKTIEVFYPGGAPAVPAAKSGRDRTETTRTTGDLHVCATCASELVYPVEWEAGDQTWDLTLRCPNCEAVTEGAYPEALVEDLDEALERGSRQLMHDLRELTHANMADEIDRFVAALRGDHIQPDDF